MQLTFPFAPPPRATRPQAAKAVPEGVTVPEALHRGLKIAFPKNANAVRVTIGQKTTVVLKADVDTLKGAGVATMVEFGMVKNNAKGQPLRKNFKVWTAAAQQATQTTADGDPFDDDLPLFLCDERGRFTMICVNPPYMSCSSLVKR